MAVALNAETVDVNPGRHFLHHAVSDRAGVHARAARRFVPTMRQGGIGQQDEGNDQISAHGAPSMMIQVPVRQRVVRALDRHQYLSVLEMPLLARSYRPCRESNRL